MKEEQTTEEPNKELEELKQKKEEYFAGWQREKADFLNYKKQEFERLKGTLCIAKESVFEDIIPVLDSFRLAEKAISEEDKSNKSVIGLLMIKKQLQDALKALGLEEIESIGKKFDPNIHEAIEEIEGEEPGMIIEELDKGYSYNGKVIRPSKVKVSK
ncbi:MAG TPA: nucleotide exchange factor GrpE [Candidatus Pacearchaeota archaeon]|nr:nucleotide exchange factor GrpE [Candidatus Pacearchaeota archaeon]HPR80071.1 nucleotide exchange factor GrpE [Candidatus Pacearchaeota archaeon]